MIARASAPLREAAAQPAASAVMVQATGHRRWLTEVVPALIGLVLFLAALEVLRIELRTVTWPELMADVLRVPAARFVLAIALTVVNYAVLTGYDLLAFIYIGNPLPRAKVLLTSFLAYAVSHNVGFAMLSGASVRYRFYSRWGVTAAELSRIVFSYSVTFWLGLLTLGGLSLAVTPIPASHQIPGAGLLPISGVLLTALAPAYLAATLVRKKPLRLWTLQLPLPTTRVAAAQFALSVVDWALAGAVLYVLLPPIPMSFIRFMGIFLASILLGMVSHVPGGLACSKV